MFMTAKIMIHATNTKNVTFVVYTLTFYCILFFVDSRTLLIFVVKKWVKKHIDNIRPPKGARTK